MKRAKHITFKAYPTSWILEGILKSQAQVTALHYGRSTETTSITPELVRSKLNAGYVKIAKALSLHFGEEFLPSDLFGLSIDHNLITGQLKVSVEHRKDGDEQKYNIEFTQAAGNWTLPERCMLNSDVAKQYGDVSRVYQSL